MSKTSDVEKNSKKHPLSPNRFQIWAATTSMNTAGLKISEHVEELDLNTSVLTKQQMSGHTFLSMLSSFSGSVTDNNMTPIFE